ncbi:hypothetical protein EGW08_001484 [Elysia chlorotica]|uniref:Protein-tyrosine-phosphatase n=1 Tax=Elysia chlorotica TaxID=188477 RepID=A0A3S1A0K3_ELYCH|nr:hypothetical protein EGW08_001484 [Elysia chlorotica]
MSRDQSPAADGGISQTQKTRPRARGNNPLSQITEHVFLAGITGVTRPDLLRSAGITHVLNVAGRECSHLPYDLGPEPGEKPAPIYADPDLREGDISGRHSAPVDTDLAVRAGDGSSLTVRHVSLRDSPDQSLLPYLDDLVDFVSEAVSSGGRVVVHCMAGVSRSASVVLAYLVRDHGMSLRQAHDHVMERRDVIRPNQGFWVALIEYELNLRGKNSVEILNYVAGGVPSLDSCQREMQMRLRLGWMDHLFFNLFVQVVILIAQILSSHWIFYDYT